MPIGFVHPKRYVLLEVKGMEPQNLIGSVIKVIQELYGIIGASKIRIALKHYENGKAIIETTNKDLPRVMTALAFASIRSKAKIRVRGIYGTIKKCIQSMRRQKD